MGVNFTPDYNNTNPYRNNLTPFKLFCYQNFPFIEETFDSLTTYKLLQKIVEYLNNVIENQNTVQDNMGIQNENIKNLYNAYNELQNYVNNYFDNLDVQEEINNKLNEMVEDGTLSKIINQEIFGNINKDITNLKNETERISNTTFENPIFPAIRTEGNHAKAVFFDKINTNLNIIQKTKGGYLMYELNKSNGDTSQNSVGLVWDLIRIKKIQKSLLSYVAKNDYDNSTGNITTLIEESDSANNFEVLLYSNGLGIPNSGSKKYNKGLKVYGMSSGATITYNMKTTQNNKGNILFYCSSGSSKKVNIYINDNLIAENLDLSKYGLTGNNPFLYEFEIPMASTLKDYTIKIENADETRVAYISCVNYYELKDYNGQYIDSFKVLLTNEFFINANGASDYAIKDVELNKWCGSFHGGETAISQKIIIPSPSNQVVQYWENNYRLMEINSINNDMFFLTPTFMIEQVTNINNKGKMFSNFNFDNDGLLDMNFDFYDGNIKSNQFYTALTCNDKSFDIVKNPNNTVLPENDRTYLKNNNGLVMFRGNSTNSKLNIYYSKFNNNYIEDLLKNGWVENVQYYNKFYFGVIDEVNNEGTILNNIQFRKIIESHNI